MKKILLFLLLPTLLFADRIVYEHDRMTYDLSEVDAMYEVELVAHQVDTLTRTFPSGVVRQTGLKHCIDYAVVQVCKAGRWPVDSLRMHFKESNTALYNEWGDLVGRTSFLVLRAEQVPRVPDGAPLYLLFRETENNEQRYLGFANAEERKQIECADE